MAKQPSTKAQEILQALARMLEKSGGGRITTSALAAELGVSEAALYRHFPSKTRRYEGLIDFIEETIFARVRGIVSDEPNAITQCYRILSLVLAFAEKNPGMTRVLLGDALLQEDDRLQERITQVLDRVEASLKQALRIAQTQGGNWAQLGQEEVSIRAAMLMSFVLGRWHRFARSGFKKLPTEASDVSLRLLLSE